MTALRHADSMGFSGSRSHSYSRSMAPLSFSTTCLTTCDVRAWVGMCQDEGRGWPVSLSDTQVGTPEAATRKAPSITVNPGRGVCAPALSGTPHKNCCLPKPWRLDICFAQLRLGCRTIVQATAAPCIAVQQGPMPAAFVMDWQASHHKLIGTHYRGFTWTKSAGGFAQNLGGGWCVAHWR